MMNQATVALIGLLAAASPDLAAAPLANLKGTARVLVVSAPAATDPALVRQNHWLQTGAAGLRDRDVLVIRIVGRAVDAPRDLTLDAQDLRRSVGLKAVAFGAALVGKDGSEVFRRSQPISMTSLFRIIDAMPMRQQEMRRGIP